MTVTPLTAHPCEALSGQVTLPGDKSISHRALMLSAVAVGPSQISGLLEGEDVLCTANALRGLGAEIQRGEDGIWRVWGRGVGGLAEPEDVLDMGNSGTAARLLLGLLASHDLTAVMTGDASLRSRPMARVIRPLSDTGAQFLSRARDRLPLAVNGTAEPMPLRYRLPVASAQVKSAILLAGLSTPGVTEVIEPSPSRDHSEIMLAHFGAQIDCAVIDPGESQADEALKGVGPTARRIRLIGQPELTGRDLQVPADPSSAAFPMVAALTRPGSDVLLPAVGINPLRCGLIATLQEMGGDISLENQRDFAGEPVADLRVKGSRLQGIEVPAERVPAMIDEFPVLAVAAAAASGTTVMRGLAELRVKESDRLAVMARGLAACGVEVEEGQDSLTVTGAGNQTAGGRPRGGGQVQTHLDHRIAMSFLVLGSIADQAVTVDDGAPIETSFPGFGDLMNRLGARIEPAPDPAPGTSGPAETAA